MEILRRQKEQLNEAIKILILKILLHLYRKVWTLKSEGTRGSVIRRTKTTNWHCPCVFEKCTILILDEATSALDNQAEHIVQQAIDNLMKDRTVFVIAHRLSTIQNANRIAVLNKGCLVELGTHDELLNIPNGEYKKLYNMQFG